MNGNNATHQVDHWFVVLLCGTINTIVLVVVVGGVGVVVVVGGWCDTHTGTWNGWHNTSRCGVD